MFYRVLICFLCVTLMFLVGCNKIADKASEKIAEKAIEQATGGKVDITDGGEGITVRDDTGGELALGNAAKLPSNWPPELPLYPGAEIVSAQSGSEDGCESMSISLFTKEKAEPILEYYLEKANAAGFVEVSKIDQGGAYMVSMVREDYLLTMHFIWSEEEGHGGGRVTLSTNTKGTVPDKPENLPSLEGNTEDLGEYESVDGSDGDGVSVDNLPEGFPVELLKPYPGGKIINATRIDSAFTMILHVQDSQENVNDYYDEHFKGRGWKLQSEMTSPSASVHLYESSAGMVNLSIIPDGDTLEVNLLFDVSHMEEEQGSSETGSVGTESNEKPIATVASTERIPAGFPSDVLPMMPGCDLESAVMDGGVVTLVQYCPQASNMPHKHYNKVYSEAGWKLTKSASIDDIYQAVWEKDGKRISESIEKVGRKESRITLLYE